MGAGCLRRRGADRLAPASPALTPAGVTAASQNQLRCDDPLPGSDPHEGQPDSDRVDEAVSATREQYNLEAGVEAPHGHRAKKALSQHFLIDPNLQKKIVAALEPRADERVVEIGPGTGALTSHLVGRVAHLRLIELDDALAARLGEEYGGRADVQVTHADALTLTAAQLGIDEEVKVIGNIPYGITSPLIFHLLESRPRPRLIVLTVQREVADRLVARPGGKSYGALTVGVQSVAAVETLFPVSRHAFRPRPEVDSTVVRILPHAPPVLSPAREEALRQLTRAAFSRRRKQLQKVLRQAPEYDLSQDEVEALLRAQGIDPAIRPDALPVEDYIRLATALAERD